MDDRAESFYCRRTRGLGVDDNLAASAHPDGTWHLIAEAAFDSVANSMKLGLALIDSEGLVTFANSKLEQLLGCEARDLSGLGWIDVLGTDNAEQLACVVDRPEVGPLQHTDGDVTFQVSDPGHDDRLVRARSWPVFHEHKYLCRIAVFLDVSDRRDEFKRRHVTDELIGTFMESVNDAVLVLDNNGRIESASHSVESVFGWPSWSVVGASIKMLLNPIDQRGDVEFHDLREIESLSARLDQAARTDELTGLLSHDFAMSTRHTVSRSATTCCGLLLAIFVDSSPTARWVGSEGIGSR